MTLFTNARIIQTTPPYRVEENTDVLVTGELITEVGKDLKSKYPKATIIDCSGKTLIPGMVCSHHHYYSGLSRGMLVQAGAQNDFIQVLKEWWWRLDRALDEEALYYSSLICSLDAIKAGTTSCIDHHASPSFIEGSLDTIAKGMREVGIRGSTCYEVTDRNGGLKEMREGTQENIRFAKEVDKIKKEESSYLVEAMVGAHAPFTVTDEGFELLQEACHISQRGLHIHVAEDSYDVSFSHHHYHKDLLVRLNQFNLLNEKTLLVHGLYLNEEEIELLNERGCFLAHNPRSNMNNHVGYFKSLQHVENLVLGTDGCGGNMFEEIKIAFFKHKDEGLSWWPADFVKVLARGNALLESSFKKKFGKIEKDYVADITILDYQNPTPLVDANAATHIVWGVSSNNVESVMVNGKMVMSNRQFDLDVEEIYAKAAETAKKVWKRVDTIAP